MVDDEPSVGSIPSDVPNIVYMTTPSVVMVDNDGSVVDLESSTDELNRIASEGWALIAVDQGVAYWCMDVASLAEVTEYEEELCGFCYFRDGNLCSKTGMSVIASDTPAEANCFKKLEN